AADRGVGHRADRGVRGERLDRAAFGAVRHQGRLHLDRHRDRADADRAAVRRPLGAARVGRGAARSGRRRRDARCGTLLRLPPHHLSDGHAGAADRVHDGLCARDRRVRLGHLHRGQSADEDGDHTAADRHQARAVRLCGRRGARLHHAGDVVRDAALDQSVASMGAPPTRRGGPLMSVGTNKEVLAEIASRPGRDTVLASATKLMFITLSLLFLGALLFAPLLTVFAMAFEKGMEMYFESFRDSDTLAAIRLTLTVAAIVVPVNTIFGIAAAWAIAKFEFKGKSVLITLIDLPIAVSPVISG